MEQWEIDLRARLEKELPHGYYEISGGEGGFVAGTGKQGKIEFEVAMVKAAKNWKPEPRWKDLPRKKKKHMKKHGWLNCGYEHQIQLAESGRKKLNNPMHEATMDDFADMMKLLEQNLKNL